MPETGVAFSPSGYVSRWASISVTGGIVPAFPGLTIMGNGQRRLTSVHPRVPGATVAGVGGHQDAAGSSPRARGYRLAPILLKLSRGFIPVRPGLPASSRKIPLFAAVYPRSPGAIANDVVILRRAYGLSPFARGYPSGTQELFSHFGTSPLSSGQAGSCL